MNRVQKAADAAALAGVPYLPFDLANATIRAKEVAKRNGYDDASADVVVTVEIGDLASQLKVTISSRINNTFGGFIGLSHTTLTRTATADYKGPAPMGSPCNTFGNEPNAGAGSSSPTPTGTAQGTSPFANCSRNPTFWGVLEGPETGKVQGDRYQTRGCEATGVDGCTGTTNDEYGPKLSPTSTTAFGYTFVVKVQPRCGRHHRQPAGLRPDHGQRRAELREPAPSSSSFGTHGQRQLLGHERRCQEPVQQERVEHLDVLHRRQLRRQRVGGHRAKHAMTTSFVLRQQVDSLDATAAPVQNDTSGSPCIKQYGSYVTTTPSMSANLFKSAAGSYDADVARMFHNWVPLCTLHPDPVR